jgi:hypothetical protein
MITRECTALADNTLRIRVTSIGKDIPKRAVAKSRLTMLRE